MNPSTSSGKPTSQRGQLGEMPASVSIGEYLIRRLQDYGIEDVFGIPGDYVLAFYSELEQSPINVVGCTREDCAGFAADAYARLRGMGAVCVTYCVGGLSVCNSIAGAFAEKSPVVVISGAPGVKERVGGALLHHMVRDFRTQVEVFEKFTIATAELTDPVRAFAEIDRVLDVCYRYKRPVYIELPRDMVHVVPAVTHAYRGMPHEYDPSATAEAVSETIDRLHEAKNPVIVAGVEIHRFGLQSELLAIAESARIPIAATMLGKSVIGERHPLYIGLYEGGLGDPQVTEFVESSDLILLLGTFLTDINLGVYTANLDPLKCVYATSEQLRVSHHHYHNVDFKQFLLGISGLESLSHQREIPAGLKRPRPESMDVAAEAHGPLRTSWIMSRINRRLDSDTIVIADVGDSLFAATELTIHDNGEFLSPAYYTSMGFSVPAALGAATARPDHRIVVLVGDGAFQMTGQELSSLIRDSHAPIIIVLDNHGYGTERFLHEGEWRYNEVQPWNYAGLPAIYAGVGQGTTAQGRMVRTQSEFDAALDAAWDDASGAFLIQARLEEDDASQTLRQLAKRLGQRLH